MNQILVTGPSGFLGYQVVKLLNERGFRPRTLLGDSKEGAKADNALTKLDIEPVEGNVNDLSSLLTAFNGVDTVLHLQFLLDLGSGNEVEQALNHVNVVGTRNVLTAAREAGVARVVVSSSVLAVGLARAPQPLDESADWGTFGFDLAYAVSRRQEEQEAMAQESGPGLPIVVVVNPSFTLGPDDYVGAPANTIVKLMTKWWFRFNPPIGFGMLDVRDYADGMLRAAEVGRHGRRYILSGENVMPDQLLNEVRSLMKRRSARLLIPIYAWMLYPILKALEIWSRVTGKPPKASLNVLELWGRFAWYDTSLANLELGWKARPLKESLRDTLGMKRGRD